MKNEESTIMTIPRVLPLTIMTFLCYSRFFSFFRENANRVKEHEREKKVEWMRKWEWVRQRKCIKKKTQILEFTLESFSLLIYLILIKKNEWNDNNTNIIVMIIIYIAIIIKLFVIYILILKKQRVVCFCASLYECWHFLFLFFFSLIWSPTKR